MEAATVKELDSESAWWNKTAAGQDVIRWEHSNHFPVKVGDTVSLDGKTVTITAMGEPFKTKAGRKMVYLYPETPQKRTQPFVPASRRESESPDDPMERMEWLKNRGIGGGSAGDAG